MKSIIIGNGFIGSAIAKVLENPKILDLKTNCNILDFNTLVGEFKGYDEIYHTAGMLGTSELNNNNVKAVEVNVIGTLNVFDAAIKAGVSKVFYPSKPNVWLNTYTITKYASEQFASLYNSYGKLSISSLRLFNVYGPGQHTHPIRKIVPTFAIQAILNQPIQVYGSGEQTVDMIYVDDVAELAVKVTREGIKEIMECGRGIPVTVNEVAKDVIDYFGSTAGIEYLPMREGETPETKLVADCKLDFQFSDYKETLHKTLESYRDVDQETIKYYLQKNWISNVSA